MFKAVVGRGHHEFSSSRQQDAQEFYLHIMTLIDRHQRTVSSSNPANSFKFQVSITPRVNNIEPPLLFNYQLYCQIHRKKLHAFVQNTVPL